MDVTADTRKKSRPMSVTLATAGKNTPRQRGRRVTERTPPQMTSDSGVDETGSSIGGFSAGRPRSSGGFLTGGPVAAEGSQPEDQHQRKVLSRRTSSSGGFSARGPAPAEGSQPEDQRRTGTERRPIGVNRVGAGGGRCHFRPVIGGGGHTAFVGRGLLGAGCGEGELAASGPRRFCRVGGLAWQALR